MVGNNLKFNIIRPINFTDDDIGGANISGTLIAENIEGRFEEAKASMVLLQQGISITSVYRGQCRPVDIQERDELVVSFPPYHPFLGQTFQVISVQTPSLNPKTGNDMRSFHMNRKDNARNVRY